ncbi:Fur family transcriptional regulator [Paenibacillus tarimensis]
MVSHLEEALEKMKNTGVRITPQRQAILTYLLETMTHPTADEIYKALEPYYPNMSVSTVYNNLKVFIEAGFVREMTYGDNASRFDADMTAHYHALCKVCGKMTDIEYPPLEEAVHMATGQTGFRAEGHRLEIYGVCPDCSVEK